MMMMMKNPIILLSCILLLSSLAVMASENSNGPSQCCFDFQQARLPKKKVVNYKHTDNRCAKRAVLLTMKNGAEFCVDPSVAWVQNIIKTPQTQA